MNFLAQETSAFLNTSGAAQNQPTGILSYAQTAPASATSTRIACVKTGNATGVVVNNIGDLIAAIPDQYLPDACFVMHASTLQALRTLKDAATGQFFWQPGTVLSSGSETILGYPIIISNYMPTIAANSNPILFGSFKRGYQIVDRGDLKIQYDPFTARPYISFFATKRVGGDVVDTTAFAALRVMA
jgi:HK97 family phage major capsid protein